MPVVGEGCCFVFVEGDGGHRVLRSFPTRRSAELGGAARSMRFTSSHSTSSSSSVAAPKMIPRSCASRSSRSEEHTSELQSRQYLVCRLLLDKKQKQAITLLSHHLPGLVAPPP